MRVVSVHLRSLTPFPPPITCICLIPPLRMFADIPFSPPQPSNTSLSPCLAFAPRILPLFVAPCNVPQRKSSVLPFGPFVSRLIACLHPADIRVSPAHLCWPSLSRHVVSRRPSLFLFPGPSFVPVSGCFNRRHSGRVMPRYGLSPPSSGAFPCFLLFLPFSLY